MTDHTTLQEFDLIDDIIHFINNDQTFYRKIYYPVLANITHKLNKGDSPVSSAFEEVVQQAYDAYKKKFDIPGLPEDLTTDQLEDMQQKLFKQEMDNHRSSKVDEEINNLKILAGIQQTILINPQSLNKQKYIKEHNIKYGSKEYIDVYFPLDVTRFPSGFRGRRK